jgi:hypothetical protein
MEENSLDDEEADGREAHNRPLSFVLLAAREEGVHIRAKMV